jgi:hypothetical protein
LSRRRSASSRPDGFVHATVVMRGFGPRIHVLFPAAKAWMAGMEAGHDDKKESA